MIPPLLALLFGSFAVHVVAGACPVEGMPEDEVRRLLAIELARLAPLPDDLTLFLEQARCGRTTDGVLIVIDRASSSARRWIALEDVALEARARTTALATAQIVRELLAPRPPLEQSSISLVRTTTVTRTSTITRFVIRTTTITADPRESRMAASFGPSFRSFIAASPTFGGYGSFSVRFGDAPIRGELLIGGHQGRRGHSLGDVEIADVFGAVAAVFFFDWPGFELGGGPLLEAGAVFARGHPGSSEVLARSRSAPFVALSLEISGRARVASNAWAELGLSGGGALGGLDVTIEDVRFLHLGGFVIGARAGLRIGL